MTTITMLTVTRLVRVVTYDKELLPINLHDPSMRLADEVKWDTRYIISTPAEHLWRPK